MKYPVYPKYKDSGVEWLGEIPEGWDLSSIKWISPVQRGASPRPIDDPKYFDIDGEYAWVRISDVTLSESGYLETTTEQLSKLGANLSVKLGPGSLFISIAGTVGKPCITKIKACIHDGFVYFPALQMNPRFLFRIFESGACYGGLGKFGTQLNLNTDTIGSIRIGVPPQNEIENLLVFLDSELTKVDGLIKDYEELIALLQEKRQALISHAVTRGLSELVSPDDTDFGEWAKPVKFKDSGVKWLGEIPEGWEISKLGCEAWVRARLGWKGLKAEEYVTDGYVFLSTPNIKEREIDFANVNYINEQRYMESPEIQLKTGDVLLAKDGSTLGTVNFIKLLPKPATVNSSIAVITPYKQLDGLFLTYLFYSSFMKALIQLFRGGMGVPHLFQEDINKFNIPLPPISIQKKITEFLDKETSKIDSLISETESTIALLKEHRSALITNAVTGKINVEGLVAAK